MVIFFFRNDLLIHRKFNKDPHDGERYVDRIVIPESYRNEILHVGHTIPLADWVSRKHIVT